MTTTAAPPADPDGPPRRPLLLVAAAVVAVVVVVLVLLLGVARPPVLVRVGDDPALTPPAELAVLGYGDRGGQCLTVVEVDGDTRRPWCTDTGGQLVAWDERGVVLRTHGSSGDVEVAVDPETGEVVSSRQVPFDELSEPPTGVGWPGADVTTSRPGGELEVRLTGGAVLWRTDAPETYDVQTAVTAPDGELVALLDSAGRLLLVPADGSAEPRVWVEDLGGWSELAWRDGAAPDQA